MRRITLSLPAMLTMMLLSQNGTVLGEEAVGRRPCEMLWANRTSDTRSPLVDFESLDGWTVACVDARATLQRSRQQQLWGDYVGSLVYRGTGKEPKVVIKPPKPIPIAGPFDCVNLWVYGNNWAWSPDPKTPPGANQRAAARQKRERGARDVGAGAMGRMVAHAPPPHARTVGPSG